MQKNCRKRGTVMNAKIVYVSRMWRIPATGFPSLGGGFDSRIPLNKNTTDFTDDTVLSAKSVKSVVFILPSCENSPASLRI